VQGARCQLLASRARYQVGPRELLGRPSACFSTAAWVRERLRDSGDGRGDGIGLPRWSPSFGNAVCAGQVQLAITNGCSSVGLDSRCS
jgi:hypothetical protein